MTDTLATAASPGLGSDGATVLARRDADGHPVVVLLDRAAAGEPVDWAAFCALPPHRVIFRRGRTGSGPGAREDALAAALAAVEGPGSKDRALDMSDRRLSMRERSEAQHRLEKIAYDMFRLDRTAAVTKAATVTRGGGPAVFNASLIKARPRGFVPAAQDTAPMLRLVIDFARELVAHELRRTGDRKDAVPTNYPELMADFAFPSPDTGPVGHLRALEAIADRLAAYSNGTEKGVRHAVKGHFRNRTWVGPSVAANPSSEDHGTVAAYLRCLGPAIHRGLAEEKEGLLVDEMALADDSALASLAP